MSAIYLALVNDKAKVGCNFDGWDKNSSEIMNIYSLVDF